MNKKEVLEIRRQFSPDNCAITRICGCYVDHEKEKKMEFKKAFLSLPEEEAFKYFDIFRHTLSGTLGKNLINMEFPLEQEAPGGTQEFLLKLRDSRLEDDLLTEEFYDKVIENYDYAENYFIILIHAVYDVPGKASDGLEMFDASDTVYEHILCSICPVNLSKAGLSYNAQTNSIEDRIRDWLVDDPVKIPLPRLPGPRLQHPSGAVLFQETGRAAARLYHQRAGKRRPPDRQRPEDHLPVCDQRNPGGGLRL